MEPDQRRQVSALPADNQRDMFAQVVGRAERNDFRFLACGNWQPGAGGDGEVRCVLPRGKIGGRDGLRLPCGYGIDQERRQYPGQPRQLQRRSRCAPVIQMLGGERTLHRVDEIERRVGHRAGMGQVEGFRAPDQHRRIGLCCFALVGKLERRSARGGDQHAPGGNPLAEAGFCRQQGEGTVEFKRPAVTQRIDRQRHAARRGGLRLAQRSNSVISGTWSEHCTQSRVSSTTRCARACGASSGEAHIWSRRRPRSPSFQSLAR